MKDIFLDNSRATVVAVVVILGLTISYALYSNFQLAVPGLRLNAPIESKKMEQPASIDNQTALQAKRKLLAQFTNSPGPNNISPYQSGAQSSSSNSDSVQHPFPNLPSSRNGLALQDDPFAPKSAAEQAWLDRNGYPNAAQYSTYASATEMQLLQAVSAGDKMAKVYLDQLRMRRGDKNAETDLLMAGAMGNSFALEMLASELASKRIGSDPIEAYALSQVAVMRGNFALALARDLFYPVHLTIAQRTDAEERARYYFQLFMEQQQKTQGATAVFFDPRPIGDDGG